MRIVTQLRMVSALSIICLGIAILLAGWQLQRLLHEYQTFSAAQQSSYQLMQMQTEMLGVSRSDPVLAETADTLHTAEQRISKLGNQTSALLNPAQGKTLQEAIEQGWLPYLAQFQSAVKIAAESPQDALVIPEQIYGMYLAPMLDKLRQLNQVEQQRATTLQHQIDQRITRLLWLILAPLAIAGLIVILPQWWVSRSIAQRLAHMSQTSHSLAQGDLTIRAPEYDNELGELSRAINRSVSSLSDMIRSSMAAAGKVRAESTAVSHLSHQVLQGTETQSRDLAEMLGAMQTLNEAVSTISQLAQRTASATAQAQQASRHAVGASEHSNQQLQDMENHFHMVENSTRSLVESLRAITGVANSIRDIAGQTNLLALNAAIEAARAGEQGRGFAVVADEVRQLSAHTHDATQEISRILQETNLRTSSMLDALGTAALAMHGSRQGSETLGKAMTEIDDLTQEVHRLTGEIGAAIEEQTQACASITGGIADLDQAARETARHTETMAKDLQELNAVSDRLEAGMAGFRLV